MLTIFYTNVVSKLAIYHARLQFNFLNVSRGKEFKGMKKII